MQKLKILMCSEASFLNSGFSIYAKELLTRLYNTNKYDIAEFASYANVNDPRDSNTPWTIYANAVQKTDPRYKEYSSRSDNMFGRWRFDKVVIDFKPDVVIDIRDYWMSSYQELSPSRKFFHWILMPTVDSAPQQQSWISTFLDADAIFTYSDWGAKTLETQSNGQINYIDTVSPGVDLSTFTIQDKTKCRRAMNIPPDTFIIGSVMRNQKRKLIPELFKSFRQLLDDLENNSLVKQIPFLYLHTSYPDAGWDIPELLKEHRLANRVLFTYVCKRCNDVTCGVFAGPSTICDKCLSKNKVFPSVAAGIESKQLSVIYNVFDIYVQYAICEGFGMPQVEAAACGIPIATIDYSAMCDIIEKLKAFPVGIQTYFKELETRAVRVYPNNDDLISAIKTVMNWPAPIVEKKRIETRKLTEKFYNWDDVAKKWEKYLDQIEPQASDHWNRPVSMQKITNIKENAHLENMISICKNNLGDINMFSSHKILTILNDIDYGFQQNGMSYHSYDINSAIEQLNILINNNNELAAVIKENITFNDDFIQYAKLKNKN